MTTAKEAKEKIDNYIKQIDETKIMQKISKILDKINDKDIVNRVVSWLYMKYCPNNSLPITPSMPSTPYQPPKINPYTEVVLYGVPMDYTAIYAAPPKVTWQENACDENCKEEHSCKK